jgi:rhodanese-related sulfurtransferase
MAQLIEFANHHPWLIGGLFASWIAVMFYELRARAGGVTHVSAADAVRLINKGALVIDVRKPDEFQAGHIVNARNLTLDRLKGEEDSVAKKKDKVLLAVCDNGGLSGKAASMLRKAGYTNAFSLKGGLGGWRADNLPLVK